jgi:hypothetical protein
VQEPDGHEGPIAVLLPGAETLGPIVLQSPRLSYAHSFEPYARKHHEETGKPVRLAHLVEDQHDLVGDLKDVITGWTRPMTDREKLELIAKFLGVQVK